MYIRNGLRKIHLKIRSLMSKKDHLNLILHDFIVRSNLAIHRSDTPFVIRQPICRPTREGI